MQHFFKHEGNKKNIKKKKKLLLKQNDNFRNILYLLPCILVMVTKTKINNYYYTKIFSTEIRNYLNYFSQKNI